MTIRTIRAGVLALALAAAGIAGSAPAGERHGRAPARPADAQPWSIVIVKTDDEGAVGDLLSARMPTRHALFDLGGATFTAYESSTPLCCPDRASTLTGLFEHHTGVVENGPFLRPQETIATELAAHGYVTGLFGKYLNGCGQVCARVPPGWGTWFVPTQLQKYGPDLSYYVSSAGPGSKAPARSIHGYTTDTIMGRAASWIASLPADGAPFFAYVTPIAPHDPTIPPARYARDPRCAGLRWNPPAENEADVSDKPAYVRSKPPLAGSAGYNLTPTCRTLLAVDDGLARIVQAIGPERMAHTLLVYVGDNGMSYGEHRLLGKSVPYDTGVPLQVHADGLVAPGSSIAEPVQNVDVAPTLCALAGCALGPYPTGQARPDGESFLGLLGGTQTSMGRDALLEENLSLADSYPGNPPWRAVRTTALSPLGRWLYVRYEREGAGTCELYDLAADPWLLENRMQPDSCALRPDSAGLQPTADALDVRLDELVAG